MPYCFWRSSVKFQGHTAKNICWFSHPLNRSWGDILASFCPYVCPSVRLSNGVRSVSSTILTRFFGNLHIVSTKFRKFVACWWFDNFPNFDFLPKYFTSWLSTSRFGLLWTSRYVRITTNARLGFFFCFFWRYGNSPYGEDALWITLVIMLPICPRIVQGISSNVRMLLAIPQILLISRRRYMTVFIHLLYFM